MTREVTKYTESEKYRAVTTYIMLGTLTETSKQCGIPYETLKSWKTQAWWPRMLAQIRGEENAKISARYRNIVLKTQEKLLERVEHGDVVLSKDGSEQVLPIRGRDLAVIAGIATQQMERLDSERVQEDTLSITERLTKIADELVKMNGKKKEPLTIDVEMVENA